MPSVDLESYNGQKVTICYDISGANASPRSLSNLKENLIGENVKVHRSRPDDLDMPSQQVTLRIKNNICINWILFLKAFRAPNLVGSIKDTSGRILCLDHLVSTYDKFFMNLSN